MNRPIKFRVWDKRETKGMSTQNMLYDAQLHHLWQDFVDYPGSYELMQYTDCHDSSNKEIYEGDIVKYNLDKPNIERIGIIEFSNYYKGWAIKDSHCYPLSDFGVYSLASPFLSFNWTEIVGNKFEHSELLK